MTPSQTHTLKNANGMTVELLDLGARVRSIMVPINGQLTEMTLKYDNLNDYQTDNFFIGATAGRYANRIAQGQFSLDGQTYELDKNNGDHCLHGGERGLFSRRWQLEKHVCNEHYVEFQYLSPAGEQGFPGNLYLVVSYELNDQNQLKMTFSARADQDTVINLCNHCYFTLGENSIEDLSVQISADHYLPTDLTGIPLGELRPVVGSPFDYTQQADFHQASLAKADEQLKNQNGYDHTYVLNAHEKDDVVATLTAKNLGVKLSILTDQPGMQFYSGQHLNAPFKAFQAACLEAQNFPDAPNQAHFPSALLKAGDKYEKFVIYQFDAQ